MVTRRETQTVISKHARNATIILHYAESPGKQMEISYNTKCVILFFILLYDHTLLSLPISLFRSASRPRSNFPYRRCRWPRENARFLLASDHSHAPLLLPRCPCVA